MHKEDCSHVVTDSIREMADRVWWMQKFVMQPGIPPETAVKVYRRYLKIEPTHAEEYIAYLKIKVSCP